MPVHVGVSSTPEGDDGDVGCVIVIRVRIRIRIRIRGVAQTQVVSLHGTVVSERREGE